VFYITEQLTGSKEGGCEREMLNDGVRLVCVLDKVQRTLYECCGNGHRITYCYGIAMVPRSELIFMNLHKALRQLCDSKSKNGEQVKSAEFINIRA
jgi:hypothetical protein